MEVGSLKQEVSFKFEKLRIWQDSMDFAEMDFKLSSDFPKDETFNLTSQIRRAVDSVALIISEGSILQSSAEFKRFPGYFVRSLADVVTCLHKARRRKYIDEDEFSDFYLRAFNLMNMTIGFRNTLR